jgi:hypothetical protein
MCTGCAVHTAKECLSLCTSRRRVCKWRYSYTHSWNWSSLKVTEKLHTRRCIAEKEHPPPLINPTKIKNNSVYSLTTKILYSARIPYPLNRGLGGLQIWPECFACEKNSLVLWESLWGRKLSLGVDCGLKTPYLKAIYVLRWPRIRD